VPSRSKIPPEHARWAVNDYPVSWTLCTLASEHWWATADLEARLGELPRWLSPINSPVPGPRSR
jgi:hypothetical protein